MSKFQHGFSFVFILLVVSVVGVCIYFGINYLKDNSNITLTGNVEELLATPTPTPSESGNDNAVILADIKADGIKCEPTGCSVEKVVGNYAKGNMPMAYWIAEKQGGKWKVVVTGNGIPNCKEIDSFQVPQEISGNCIDDSGNLRD